jgi:hypothetical protein
VCRFCHWKLSPFSGGAVPGKSHSFRGRLSPFHLPRSTRPAGHAAVAGTQTCSLCGQRACSPLNSQNHGPHIRRPHTPRPGVPPL